MDSLKEVLIKSHVLSVAKFRGGAQFKYGLHPDRDVSQDSQSCGRAPGNPTHNSDFLTPSKVRQNAQSESYVMQLERSQGARECHPMAKNIRDEAAYQATYRSSEGIPPISETALGRTILTATSFKIVNGHLPLCTVLDWITAEEFLDLSGGLQLPTAGQGDGLPQEVDGPTVPKVSGEDVSAAAAYGNRARPLDIGRQGRPLAGVSGVRPPRRAMDVSRAESPPGPTHPRQGMELDNHSRSG